MASKNYIRFDIGQTKLKSSAVPAAVWSSMKSQTQYSKKGSATLIDGYVEQMNSLSSELDTMTVKLGLIAFTIDQQVNEGGNNSALIGMQKKVAATMHNLGIEIINPVGKILTSELIDLVEIIKTVQEESVTSHCVGKVLSPVIYRHKKLIARADIVAWDKI